MRLCPRGFSIVELLVVLAVMGVIITPVFNVFSGSRKITEMSKILYKSINVASSYIDSLKAMEDDKFTSFSRVSAETAPADFTISGHGVPYDPGLMEVFITVEKLLPVENYDVYKILIEVFPNQEKKKKEYRLCAMKTVMKK